MAAPVRRVNVRPAALGFSSRHPIVLSSPGPFLLVIFGPSARRHGLGARRFALRPESQSARRERRRVRAGAAEVARRLQIASERLLHRRVSTHAHSNERHDRDLLTDALTFPATDELPSTRPSAEPREEIFERGSNPSEVWHGRTARVRDATAHLVDRLAALVARPSLRLEPLSLSCASDHALSAGAAHSRTRACMLLLD